MSKNKKQFWLTTVIFLALITCVLGYGTTFKDSELKVVVPNEELEFNKDYTITSVTGYFDGKEVNEIDLHKEWSGTYIDIELPEKIQEDDSLVVVSTTPNIGLSYFYNNEFLRWYSPRDVRPYTSMESEFKDNTYLKDLTFDEAIKEYKDHGYIFLLSVKGDAFEGFSKQDQKALASIGILECPSDYEKNTSYLAYSYDGKAQTLAKTDDDAVISVAIDDHNIFMKSGDATHSNLSCIEIDDVDYSSNHNGLNLVVYNPSNNTLVDSLSYNMNAKNVTMTRYMRRFNGVYTTKIDASLLHQIALHGEMAHVTWRNVSYFFVAVLLMMYASILVVQHNINTDKEIKKGSLIWRCIIVTLTLVCGALGIYGYCYLRKFFRDVSLEQLAFHMNTNLDGTNWSDYTWIFIKVILCVLVAVGIGLWIQKMNVKWCANKKAEDNAKNNVKALVLRWLGVIASIATIGTITAYFFTEYSVYDYMANIHVDATVFHDHYVDPHNVQITFPEKKQNLIYIYMESMEISAADESVGGGKSFNALPELTQLAFENDNFTNDHTVLNGAVPLTNCTWTVAGITAQSAGLPLEINHAQSNRNGAVKSFLPGALMIGDILEEQGYHNAFLLGSDAAFGNRDTLFTEHGNYDIYDYYWAKNAGKFAPDYHVWWGYEDKKLYTYAREIATDLANGDEPFNLTLLTVDTHFTDGYKCEDCPDTYEKQYSNVIACSSKMTYDFVQWVQQQPWGKDTTIVLSGDHLCMDYNYFKDMPEGYDRKTYVTVVNSLKEQPQRKRDFATIDLYPTTLSALGCKIEGNRLGFGTDLYSGDDTLLEDLGRDYLDTQFGMHSNYYQKNILDN